MALKKYIQIFQRKGKKKDLLGRWVFFAKILVSEHSYTLQNYSNFKSNFSFDNRSLEIHDHFRTRGNASYNDLSQLINTLSNKDFACLDKFKLRKIPTFN